MANARSEFLRLLLAYMKKLAPTAATTNALIVLVSSRTNLGALTVKRICQGSRIPRVDTIHKLLAPLNLPEHEIEAVLSRRRASLLKTIGSRGA